MSALLMAIPLVPVGIDDDFGGVAFGLEGRKTFSWTVFWMMGSGRLPMSC